MKNPIVALLSVVLVLLSATAGAGASAAPGFDALKKLAGEWQLKDSTGKMSGVVKYHVTSSSSAVVETMYPGTEHEMVTVYTRDGDQLAVTHFCAAGNQPRLLSKPPSVPNQIQFDFVSGGNMKSVNDLHMHSLTLTFVDDDHLQQEWHTFSKGKQIETAIFELTRKS